MRTYDLPLVMPPACPGDTYVPNYTRDSTRTSLFRVPGGGFAAAGNAEKNEGAAGLCSNERKYPPGKPGVLLKQEV